jgi:hypothetical protein
LAGTAIAMAIGLSSDIRHHRNTARRTSGDGHQRRSPQQL